MTSTHVDLIPLTVGHLTMPKSFFLAGADEVIRVPVTAHLIIHPRGLVVFDTGLGPRFCRRDGAPLEGAADLEESGRIDARIEAAGFDPLAVRHVVNSHLHTDHAGGNAWLPNSTVVVQRAELEYAATSEDIAYHRPEFETGQDVLGVDGEFDVFGDGTVLAYPTPGHTPGHQSVRVLTQRGSAVLAGDACNLQENLEGLRLPDHAYDFNDYEETLRRFEAQRRDGCEIFFSHDPQFWASLETGSPWS